MPDVVIVDTSVLLNVLDIPQRNQNRVPSWRNSTHS